MARPPAQVGVADTVMSTAIEDLKRLAGLEPYRRYLDLKPSTGGNYKAVCPFHADKNPSLVVYADARHHCFACEAHGDALDLIQYLDSCDIKTARERLEEIVGVSAPKIPQGPGEIKAVYRYTDEEGELLFEVVRYEPKNFRQRRPDPNGGMTWKLGDVRKPLYRLPQVLQSEVVWVVEGEKDADTLCKMGQVGTTTAGGSNAPWLSEHTDALTGRTVFLVPDNDEPGRKRVARLAEALTGAANEVLVVEIPAPHKDITDYVNSGATIADLRALVGAARAAAKTRWWEGLTDIAWLKSKPLEFLVDGVIHMDAITLLVGPPGSMKSYASLDIAKAVAGGLRFAGKKVNGQRPVLYIDAENPLPVVVARRSFLGIPAGIPLKYWGRFDARPIPALDDKDLLQFAREEKPLLIFDSFIRFHKGSENDNAEVAVTMGHFLKLRDAGATVIVLHHAGKDPSKDFRGAAELEAAPDVCTKASKIGDGLLTLGDFKNRLGPEKTIDLKLMEMGFEEC